MIASEARRLLAGVFCLVSVFSVEAFARADAGDEGKAVTLFEQGRKLAREGRCADAVPVLLESIRHAEGVGALLNLGSCYQTIGKMASAHQAFVRAEEVAASRDDAGRRQEAARRAESIAKDVSVLVIHVPAAVDSPELEIRLDGVILPRARWEQSMPVDAGSHEIEIVTPPALKQSSSVTVRGSGERAEWTASRFPPAPPPISNHLDTRSDNLTAIPRSPAQRTLGIVTGAVGVGGVLTGTIFGLVSLSAHSSVLDRCASYPVCPSSDRAVIDDRNDRAAVTGTISTIGFVAGAVLLAAGAVLFFTAPQPRVTR
jgi:hypothetical protein